jgi:hypothetical protein
VSPSNYHCIFNQIIPGDLNSEYQPASNHVFTKGPMGLSKDYDHEKWVKLYKVAILGLERAKLTGRIEDTRIEMAARIVVRKNSARRVSRQNLVHQQNE